VRNKRHFPNNQTAIKLIWLALRKVAEMWKNPPITWRAAKALSWLSNAEQHESLRRELVGVSSDRPG